MSKKVDNALCPIKKVDNDGICPINLKLAELIVKHIIRSQSCKS